MRNALASVASLALAAVFFGASAASAAEHPCHKLARAGKNPQAAACYKKAIAKNGKDLEARNGLAAVLAQQGQFTQALAQFDAALKVKPEDGVALNGRAMMLLALKRVDEAFSTLERALALDPKNIQALSNLALINRQTGRPDLSVELWKRVLEIDPTHEEAHLGIGEIRMAKGDLDGAVKEHFNKVIEKNPNSARGQWLLGKALSQHRPADAIPYLEAASRLAPKEPEIWYDLGLARMAISEVRLAGQALTQAMTYAPDDPRILLELGKVHMQMRDYEAAEAHFEEALVKKPPKPIMATVRYHIGILRERQGDMRRAQDEYRMALRLEPSHVPSMVNLAALLVEEKRYDEAMRPLQQILQREPDNAPARYNLGRIYIEQGKVEEGKKQLQPLLSRPEGDPLREGAETLLARVRK